MLRPLLATVAVGAAIHSAADTNSAIGDKPSSPEPMSAFEQSLALRQGVETRETIVELAGRKFRRIQFQSRTYYLELLRENASTDDLVVLCNEQGAQTFNNGTQPLLKAAVKITKHTSLYVEGLKNVCSGDVGRSQINVSSALAIGFRIDDDDNPKTILHNKRILINPFSPGLGFGAEF